MTRKFNVIPLKNRRRQLRKSSTLAERLLWEKIRNRKLGQKFIRQYSVEGYVLDFYCPRTKLAIELEGEIHQERSVMEYDKYRFRYIEAFDIQVIRFNNSEIINDIEVVLQKIVVSLSFPKRGIKGEL